MAAAAVPAASAPNLGSDLSGCIDKTGTFCLNEKPEHTHANLFQGDDRLYLESDADEQLLVNIQFRDTVRLKAINLQAPEGELAPTRVSLFVNRVNMGFQDMDGLKPDQTLDLTEADLYPDAVTHLYSVKFQRVSSITLFVENDSGSDVTRLTSLRVLGDIVDGTNMAEFKKVG